MSCATPSIATGTSNPKIGSVRVPAVSSSPDTAARLWAEVPDNQVLTHVIGAERRDLWSGDIPCFAARPDSRDVWFDKGRRLPDVFAEPSVSAVERRVGQLSDTDRARQAWVIEASLASLPGGETRWPSYTHTPSLSPAAPDRLLRAAMRVGERLGALALRGTAGASWVVLQREDRTTWSIARAGLDLDAGIPGIALYLAYLGTVSGVEHPTILARDALATQLEVTQDRASSLSGIGAFDGLGGLVYVLSHLSALWGRPDLLREAHALGARLPDLIDQDDAFSVFAGAAGCILTLRSLHRCAPSDRVVTTAVRCGEHLLRSCVHTGRGLGWPGLRNDRTPHARFLHGTAGVATALLELHAWTGDDRFQTTAMAALEGEPTRTRPSANADRSINVAAGTGGRDEVGSVVQGAEVDGIGLARLCGSDARLSEPGERADVRTVAETIRDHGFGRDHSLGAGDLGSHDLLARAASMLEDEAMAQDARWHMGGVLDDADRQGWRCGTPLGVETPGLLAGLAGMGCALLRGARPDIVPSLLTLDPPSTIRRTHGS
mgnify:CR=1 FL=1